MQGATLILWVLLVVVATLFAVFWVVQLTRRKHWQWPTWYQSLVGFITDFLDTLGIGSFAVTTTLYRPFNTVRDEDLPGTLNVGHTLPTVAQALIFFVIVKVDSLTLWLLIAASVVGAWFGASFVSRMTKWKVQLGMGCALLIAVILLVLKLQGLLPSGGEAVSLTGGKLALACGLNLLFGALMTIGVGAYAPIMIMVSLLGMNPDTAFPIMMGSCAFLMPAASWQFIRNRRYDVPAALGLTALGIPGVLVAAFIVQKMDTVSLSWLVVCVASLTAIIMIRAGARGFQIVQPKSATTDDRHAI